MNIFTSMGLGMEAMGGSSVIVCCSSAAMNRVALNNVLHFLYGMGRVTRSGRDFVEVSGGGKIEMTNRFESLLGRRVDVVFLGPGTEDRYWHDAAVSATLVCEGVIVRD